MSQAIEKLPDAAGTRQRLAGNNPLLLDDPSSVWIVEMGAVDVFVVPLSDGRPSGARSYTFSVEAGAALFGVDLKGTDTGLGLLAVGTVGTEVVKVPLASLRANAADPSRAAEVAALVDDWVSTLASGVTAGGPLQTDVQITPGTSVKLAPGQRAHAASGVVWITLDAGDASFLDQEALAERLGGAAFPLVEAAWLRATVPAELSAVPTTDVIGDDAAWTGLATYHQSILRAERRRLDARASTEVARLRQEFEHDQSVSRQALAELAGVLDRTPVTHATVAVDPLLAACKLVGAALGITVVSPPQQGDRLHDPLSQIAKASRIRLRQVTLPPSWWREESGPMLGFLMEGRRPVALLPAPRRTYDLVDGVDGARTKVSQEVAQRLASDVWVFYRPFPDQPLGVWDLLRLGLRDCRDDLASVALMGMAAGLLATLTPIATGIIFGSLIPQSRELQVVQLAGALILCACAIALFQILRGIAITRVEARIDGSIQPAVWDRLLRLPVSFFRDYTAGDLANRANGIDAIRQILTGTTITSILSSIFSLFSFLLLFYYDVRLALLAALLTFVALIVTLASSYLQLRHERRMIELQGKISGVVLQFLAGIPKLRAAGAESRAYAVWAALFARQQKESFQAQMVGNVLAVFNSTWPVLATVAIFATVVASQPVTISAGNLLAFLVAFAQFLAATLLAGTALSSVLQCVPLYERSRPIFRALPEVDVARADPGVLKGDIEINHVAFRYQSDGPLVLHDVSLRIEPGQFVAFVGPSGAGKSSLFRLLLGFDTPEGGSIYYDGQDLAGLDTEAVRRQMGVVTQDSKVTPGPIFANIVGTRLLTIDDAWDAARSAGLDEDVRRMPMGMQTYISEGGSTFSGGQLQRLMIARALAGKPRILLFDEATSALDNRTQAIVSQSLGSLRATRIAIAHRLSTIEKADRIFVIQAGRIVQSGTYAELIAIPGPFADLAKRQLA